MGLRLKAKNNVNSSILQGLDVLRDEVNELTKKKEAFEKDINDFLGTDGSKITVSASNAKLAKTKLAEAELSYTKKNEEVDILDKKIDKKIRELLSIEKVTADAVVSVKELEVKIGGLIGEIDSKKKEKQELIKVKDLEANERESEFLKSLVIIKSKVEKFEALSEEKKYEYSELAEKVKIIKTVLSELNSNKKDIDKYISTNAEELSNANNKLVNVKKEVDGLELSIKERENITKDIAKGVDRLSKIKKSIEVVENDINKKREKLSKETEAIEIDKRTIKRSYENIEINNSKIRKIKSRLQKYCDETGIKIRINIDS